MAWTTPKTFAALTELTASELNTHLRDNLNYLKSIADAVSFSGCQALRTTNQSIGSGSDVEISFTSQQFDYGDWFAPTSTDVIVPAAAIPSGFTAIGLLVIGAIRWEANSSGSRAVRIAKNGTAFGYQGVGGTADIMDVAVTDFCTAAAGDTITMLAKQTSGSTLVVNYAQLSVFRFGVV
jgi:hypothetical protein